jgi:DNA-binding MarR family transcriptional regulator
MPTGVKRSVGTVLKQAEQTMLRVKTAALKPVGLTLAQYVALAALDRQPGITAAALARASLVTPQAMMVVLKALEEQGLISRSAHPRHTNVLELRLTEPGREALAAGRACVEPIERQILGAFSADELATLEELLARWVEAVPTD